METNTGGQFVSKYSFCILKNPNNLGPAGAEIINSRQRSRAVFQSKGCDSFMEPYIDFVGCSRHFGCQGGFFETCPSARV